MEGTHDESRQGLRDANYDSLKHPDSTRILTLFPATDWDAELEGDLNETRLSDELDVGEGYTALSYVWGTVHESHTLKLRKGTIAIGTNLDHALRDLRLFTRPCRIWVDAICINQKDLEERNHQVQQMRDIYAAARNTVIYLGNQGSNTCLSAWNFLERNSSWAWNDNLEVDVTKPSTIEEHTISFRGELADVEHDVLDRHWFRRLWVFQEAVVSRHLSIQCGRRRISWDDFCRIVLKSRRYHDRYGFSLTNRTRYEIVRDIHLTRCEYLESRNLKNHLPEWRLQPTSHRGNWLGILNMLERGRSMEASDPRDKIYGLLGISNGIDITQPGFEIDYRESWQQVYTRFARNIINITGRCDILSYVIPGLGDPYIEEKAQEPLLPSWVPDWNRDASIWGSKTRTILSTVVSNDFVPSLAEKDSERTWAVWANDGMVLILKGCILGSIESHAFGPVALLGHDEVALQALRDGAADERARRQAVMRRWDATVRGGSPWARPNSPNAPLLLRLDRDEEAFYRMRDDVPHGQVRRQAVMNRLNASVRRGFSSLRRGKPHAPDGMTLNTSHFDTSAYCSDADKFRVCFDTNNIEVPTTVESHLYSRSRQTATWSDGNNMAVAVIVDQESIVDGRKLGVCKVSKTGGDTRLIAMSKQRAWCLMPDDSRDGDFIVHLSGCRVPFVMRSTKYHSSDGARCGRIIGECLLNGYDELSRAIGDDRDTFYIH